MIITTSSLMITPAAAAAVAAQVALLLSEMASKRRRKDWPQIDLRFGAAASTLTSDLGDDCQPVSQSVKFKVKDQVEVDGESLCVPNGSGRSGIA